MSSPSSCESRDNPDRSREPLIVVGLAALVVVLAVVFARQAVQFIEQGWTDLRLYEAAARILTGPRPELLYDWVTQQRLQEGWKGPASPFINPPFVALLFVPLLHLPPLAALAGTAAVEALATAVAMVAAGRMVDRRAGIILALAALAQPLMLQTWLTVQPAPLVTLAWAGFALAYLGGAPSWAAACIVAGMAVKPHLVLPLAVFLCFSRDGRAIVVLAGGAALLALLAWTMVGTAGIARYPGILQPVAASGHWAVNAAAMPNLRGVLAALFGDTPATRRVAIGLSLAVMVALAWLARRPQPDAQRRAAVVALALAGTMLASYHMHVQELGGLYVVLAAAVAAGWLPRARMARAALILTAALWALDLAGMKAPRIWAVLPVALGVGWAAGLWREGEIGD